MKIAAAVVGALVLLGCMGLLPLALEIPTTLVFGWIVYLARTLPQVQIRWPTVVSALACLVTVLLLGHTLARWLWRETAPATRPPWRLRWTYTASAVVLLMFTAGIAAVGITHQSVWLARSDARLVEFSGTRRVNQIKCGSNLRVIGYAIQEYARQNNGRYPDSLAQLLVPIDISAECFVCPSTDTDKAPAELPRNEPATSTPTTAITSTTAEASASPSPSPPPAPSPANPWATTKPPA